jgi:hypothetical protein
LPPYRTSRDVSANSGTIEDGDLKRALRETCYMTLVYCGDLHRYKQQQKRQQQQQDVASDIYMRAGHLQPWNGLAWNQLAVICSSSSGSGSGSGSPLEAAFYYMRAASSRVAFPAAGENLRILLEKTRSVVSGGGGGGGGGGCNITSHNQRIRCFLRSGVWAAARSTAARACAPACCSCACMPCSCRKRTWMRLMGFCPDFAWL